MRVRNLEAGRHVSGDGLGVVKRSCNLINGVDDRLAAILLLRQLLPSVLPLVACIQNDRITLVGAIRFELHGDAGGTDLVLVVLVIPNLFHMDGDLAGRMRVGQRSKCRFCSGAT